MIFITQEGVEKTHLTFLMQGDDREKKYFFYDRKMKLEVFLYLKKIVCFQGATFFFFSPFFSDARHAGKSVRILMCLRNEKH